jgi:hypothetical protein
MPRNGVMDIYPRSPSLPGGLSDQEGTRSHYVEHVIDHMQGHHMKRARYLSSSLAGLAIALSAMVAGTSPAAAACNAQAQSLLNDLKGAWRGSGTVKPIGGAQERISCRVDYRTTGPRVSQKISCAGTDYKFDASADVSCENNNVSGTWTEKVANNTGRVKGNINGKRMNIEVEGPNFQGRFAVKINGSSRHSLTITQFDPGVGRHVPVAEVSLRR